MTAKNFALEVEKQFKPDQKLSEQLIIILD